MAKITLKMLCHRIWSLISVAPPSEERADAPFHFEGHHKVTRFLFSDRDFSRGRPKPGAFLPVRHEGAFETSVCRVDGVQVARIWHLAATARKRDGKAFPAKARTEVSVSDVRGRSLDCSTAPEIDFDEHSVIVKWPEVAENSQAAADDLKAEHKRICVELASLASDTLIPPAAS